MKNQILQLDSKDPAKCSAVDPDPVLVAAQIQREVGAAVLPVPGPGHGAFEGEAHLFALEHGEAGAGAVVPGQDPGDEDESAQGASRSSNQGETD